MKFMTIQIGKRTKELHSNRSGKGVGRMEPTTHQRIATITDKPIIETGHFGNCYHKHNRKTGN